MTPYVFEQIESSNYEKKLVSCDIENAFTAVILQNTPVERIESTNVVEISDEDYWFFWF